MMESFLYFIFSLIISSFITFGYVRYNKFTKRGIYKDIINSHLEAIKDSLENVTRFPYTYYVGETNEFTIQLADDISKKLRRKGFKVLRDTKETTCEVLLIN